MSRYLAAAQEQARIDQGIAAEVNYNASAERSRHWGRTRCPVCGDAGMRSMDASALLWHYGVENFGNLLAFVRQEARAGRTLYHRRGDTEIIAYWPCSGCKPKPPAEYRPLRIPERGKR